jgi:hypothetical protein
MSMSSNNISILLYLYSYESVLVSDTFLYEAAGYPDGDFNRIKANNRARRNSADAFLS